MRLLKPDETLDWDDLKRRLLNAFPDIHAMIAAYRDWSEQKAYYSSLYTRLDRNREGRADKNTVRESQKAAMKRMKK